MTLNQGYILDIWGIDNINQYLGTFFFGDCSIDIR